MPQIQVLSEPSIVLGNQDGLAFANGGLDLGVSVPASLVFNIFPDNKSMVVNNSEGEPLFRVNSRNTGILCQREVSQIVNGIEHPCLKLQKQIATIHARCDGYSSSADNIQTGQSYWRKQLSISKNGILQNHTDLNVKSLENGSYKIQGSWSQKSLTIYKPGSSTEIAKVLPLGTNDKFKVVVDDNVNCAFVVSIIAAVDCMKDHPGILKHVGKAVGFVMNAAAGVAFAAAGQAVVGLFSP